MIILRLEVGRIQNGRLQKNGKVSDLCHVRHVCALQLAQHKEQLVLDCTVDDVESDTDVRKISYNVHVAR